MNSWRSQVSDTLVRSISDPAAPGCWAFGTASSKMLIFMLGMQLRLLVCHTLSSSRDTVSAGMACAILASALFLIGASVAAMPVSTTHTIVGAVLGMSLVAVGTGCIAWTGLASIAASWVASPLLAGLLSAVSYWLVRRAVFKVCPLGP